MRKKGKSVQASAKKGKTRPENNEAKILTKKYDKAEFRKQQILECAKKLFSQNGYYNTQIADIIKQAKIARGTVYQYFKNKEDIFTTLLEGYFNNWEKYVSTQKMDLSSVHPVAYLHHRISKTLFFLSADDDLCGIVLRMGVGVSPDFNKMIAGFEDRIIHLVKNDLMLGIKTGNVYPDMNVEMTANLLAGAVFRVSYYYFVKLSKNEISVDPEEIAEEIVRLFSPGIFVPEVLQNKNAT